MGCLICVLSRYSTFRLSVNMYAGSFGYSVLIILNVLCIAIIYVLSMFWCLWSLLETLRPLGYIYHIKLFLFSIPNG